MAIADKNTIVATGRRKTAVARIQMIPGQGKVEVNGRDRPGLLHDVTAAISEQGLQIASAHVTTYGVRAVDVFYVKDVFGLKVENERKLGVLREALLAALASPDDVVPTPVPAPAKRRRQADAA